MAGLVPWALSGMSTLRPLLALVAEVGRGDEQGRQLALRPGGRLEADTRRSPAISARIFCIS